MSKWGDTKGYTLQFIDMTKLYNAGMNVFVNGVSNHENDYLVEDEDARIKIELTNPRMALSDVGFEFSKKNYKKIISDFKPDPTLKDSWRKCKR